MTRSIVIGWRSRRCSSALIKPMSAARAAVLWSTMVSNEKDHPDFFDKTYESNGIKIVCDVKSWFYVKGTEVDFSDDLLAGGFQLNNPNANRTCGCGTSFSA